MKENLNFKTFCEQFGEESGFIILLLGGLRVLHHELKLCDVGGRLLDLIQDEIYVVDDFTFHFPNLVD